MQANGLVVSPGNVVVIAITATLAAIGSASIPNSALVSMVTVLQVTCSTSPLNIIQTWFGTRKYDCMHVIPKRMVVQQKLSRVRKHAFFPRVAFPCW